MVAKIFVLLMFFLILPTSMATEPDPFQIQSKASVAKDGSVRVAFEAKFEPNAAAFWATVKDYGSYAEFLPQVSDSEYLGKLQGVDRVYLEVETPFPLPDVWNILDVDAEEDVGFMEWKMRKGNVGKNQGFLQVEEVPGGVRVKGEALISAGTFIPNRVVVWASKQYTPRLLRAFGKRISAQKPKIQKAGLSL